MTKLIYQVRTEKKSTTLSVPFYPNLCWKCFRGCKKSTLSLRPVIKVIKKLHEKKLVRACKFATVPNVLHEKQFVSSFVDNNHLSLTLQDFFYMLFTLL